jgi:hypothetical protein
MAEPDISPEPEDRTSVDGRRASARLRTGLIILIQLFIVPARSVEGNRERFFHRIWHGCALLGFVLVFAIEILIVPRFGPFIAPLFEDGNNILSTLPIELAGYMRSAALAVRNKLGPSKSALSAESPRYTFVDIDNDAFSEWGKSGHTDRSQIEGLISKIVAYKPELLSLI